MFKNSVLRQSLMVRRFNDSRESNKERRSLGLETNRLISSKSVWVKSIRANWKVNPTLS